MENTFVLMLLTASIGLNIYFIIIVIPGLKEYGPTYYIATLKMIRLTLQRIKYKVPDNSFERLIIDLDKEIDLIQTHIDGHKYTDKH